jgi:hypothetical protein
MIVADLSGRGNSHMALREFMTISGVNEAGIRRVRVYFERSFIRRIPPVYSRVFLKMKTLETRYPAGVSGDSSYATCRGHVA